MATVTNKCTTCGGTLKLNPRTNILTCENCRREYRDESKIPHEIEEICKERQGRSFTVAEELCREFVRKNPTVAEGYWQSLMVELGIVFVQDGEKGYKPTFFCFQNDKAQKIATKENYKKAIQYAATPADRENYERQAEYIQRVLEEFFALTAKEESYDIFISFKKSEEVPVNGRIKVVDTDDYKKAEEIYNALKNKYKVFFSPVSIGQDTGLQGEKYEPRILKALQTSQAMILVGTETRYLEAEWVQNEWKRYKYFIEKGQKKRNSLILGYMRNMPGLPAALKDIQLPSFDMFSASYLKDIEKLVGFVKSSKGMRPTIGGRKIQDGFEEDDSAFTTGYEGERVTIKTGRRGQHVEISATEERDLQYAQKVLQNKQYGSAIRKCGDILKKNPESAQAYWIRFCGKIKATGDEAVPQCVANAKLEDYEDFDKAIEFAPDQYFAWELVDLLLAGFRKGKTLTPSLLTAASKYFDAKRSKKALEAVLEKLEGLIKTNKVKQAQELFALTRKHLFVEENISMNKWATNEYAVMLFEHKQYDAARKYFEELAASEKNEDYYSYLLSCRLKTPDYKAKKFKLNVNPNDDASTKKPSELDLDEIIERILICACENGNRKVQQRVRDMVSYQIRYNTVACEDFIDSIYNVFRQLKMDDEAMQFLKEDVADVLLGLKKFSIAEKYYNEIIALDNNAAQAHWGLLKCELHLTTDYALACHRRALDEYYSFNNALNSADQDDYDHFMYVFLAQADREKKEKLKYIDYSEDIEDISLEELRERQRRKEQRKKELAKERSQEMWENVQRWIGPITWVLFGLTIAGIVLVSLMAFNNPTPEMAKTLVALNAVFLIIVIVKNTLKLIEQGKIAEAIFSHFGMLIGGAIIFFVAMIVSNEILALETPIASILSIDLAVLIAGITRTNDVHKASSSNSSSSSSKNSAAAMWTPTIVITIMSIAGLIALSGSVFIAMGVSLVCIIIVQCVFNEDASDCKYDEDYSKIQQIIPAVAAGVVMMILALNIEQIFPIIAKFATGFDYSYQNFADEVGIIAIVAAVLMIIMMIIMQSIKDPGGKACNNFQTMVAPLAAVGAYLIFLLVTSGVINYLILEGFVYEISDIFGIVIGSLLACVPGILYALINYLIASQMDDSTPLGAFFSGVIEAFDDCDGCSD